MLQQVRSQWDHDRARSAAATALLHLLLGYALVTGFGPEIARGVGDELKIFDVSLPPAPLPIEADDAAARHGPEGAASPPNLKARAAPVAAPKPEIRLKQPTPVAAAPAPGTGSDSSAGASDRIGPGQGSGGLGAGTGSGRSGAGTGGGGAAAKARLLRGRIVDADYPRSASRARAIGIVVVRFTVGTDGRPSGCIVTRSSGNAALDDTTCRLIEQRFRYEPARDAEGSKVPAVLGWKQSWWQEPVGRAAASRSEPDAN